MLKQLMLSKKIKGLRDSLNALLEDERKLATREAELAEAVEQAETEEEVDAIEESVTEIEEEKAAIAEKKSKLEGEIARLEGELEELKSKEPTNDERNKGADKMNKEALREKISMYVRTKGKVLREGDPDTSPAGVGFKVVDGGVLIPEEILQAEEFKRDVVDLSQYVKVRKVNRGAGKIPVTTKSGSAMVTVNELEQNPALAKPNITDVSYDIDTYRGYIPVSVEAIEDADYDIIGLIAEEIRDQELNTKNAAIATILKTATPKTVNSLDDLKRVLNVDLKRAYDVKLYVSASFYQVLDTLKDGNGRYLLQDSITSASGKSFAGREVVVLDDTMIGTNANDLKAFVGDAREFVSLFDRKAASAKWINHDIYGELLASFVRFDVVKVDSNAGYYVTWSDEPGLELLTVSTVAGTETEGDTVLTVAGDEGGQLAYKVADTHTIVSYGKKAVGFTKLPVDFESGDTVTLTAAVNGKVITVVELDKDNNVVRVGSGALATKQA